MHGAFAPHIRRYANILNKYIVSSSGSYRKQEHQARLYGYNKMIGLYGIISAFNAGCHSRYDMAEYLHVTEQYLQDAIDCYREKYGICTILDNYIIYFIPYLAIMEKI